MVWMEEKLKIGNHFSNFYSVKRRKKKKEKGKDEHFFMKTHHLSFSQIIERKNREKIVYVSKFDIFTPTY